MALDREAKLLAYAALRASENCKYLGWIIANYMAAENLTRIDIANLLEIDSVNLSRIELCLRPRPESFADDIKQISSKFTINPGSLANIVRLVEAFETITVASEGNMVNQAGLLMAARDRDRRKKQKARGSESDEQA